MTEVTSVRQTPRPRPLGLLKENVQYYRLSSKFQNSNDTTNTVNERVNSASKNVMQGQLQQATLINIVAAVNETFGSESGIANHESRTVPGSPTDALQNTVAVVSNLVSPRERTISIPTTQVVFEMPVESVRKKPVYYKHSEDEEVHRKDLPANVFSKNSVERTKVNLTKPHIASEKVMKRIPFKTPCFDYSLNAQNPKTVTESSKPTVSKSWSPVRRLGAWKRSESRAVHQMSKCEAVDIMDSESIRRTQNGSFSPDPTKITAEEKLKIIPPSPVNPYPFYRAKSLPAVFPVKTTKTAPSSPPTAMPKTERYRHRPLSRGNFTQIDDFRKVFNLSGGIVVDHSHTGTGLNHEHEVVSPFKLDLAKSKDAQKSPYALSGSDVSPAEVRGRAFGQGSPRHGDSEYQSAQESSSKSGDMPHLKDSLHSAAKFTLSGRPKSSASTTSSRSQPRNVTSANSRKSCIAANAGRNGTSDVPGRRTPKKVKFARRPSSTSTVSNTILDDEPVAKINAFGGSSVFQTPRSDITAYSPGPQPMSAQELLRLKQKLIPANVHVELANKSSYNFTSHTGMKIRSIQQRSDDISYRNLIISDSDDENSECNLNSGVTTEAAKEETDIENVNTDKLATGDKVRGSLSDLDNDCDETDSDEEMSKVEASREISYKLVKAVDLDSYSEFEHKKMRKVLSHSFNANRGDNTKAHFVKVQLKEGE